MALVYPPCNTVDFQALPLEPKRRHASATVLSIAQVPSTRARTHTHTHTLTHTRDATTYTVPHDATVSHTPCRIRSVAHGPS